MNLDHLYRAVIMEHYKSPLHKGLIEDPSYFMVHLHNPSCGDDMTIQVKVTGHQITDIRHEGTGCSICCSSASVMSETLINKEVNEALKVIDAFYNLLMAKPYDETLLIGDALAYGGVSQFPARIKCASLAWKALEQGLIIEGESSNG